MPGFTTVMIRTALPSWSRQFGGSQGPEGEAPWSAYVTYGGFLSLSALPLSSHTVLSPFTPCPPSVPHLSINEELSYTNFARNLSEHCIYIPLVSDVVSLLGKLALVGTYLERCSQALLRCFCPCANWLSMAALLC